MFKGAPVEQEKKNNLLQKFVVFILIHICAHKIKLRISVLQPPSPINNVPWGLSLATCLNPSSRRFKAVVEPDFLKDNFNAFSDFTFNDNCYCFACIITSNLNFEFLFQIFNIRTVIFSSKVATVYEILAMNKSLPYKIEFLHYNMQTIVLLKFLPLEAAFHKFSTLWLVTFDPNARFRSKFFQTMCDHKAYPPKMFLILHIIAAVHRKQEHKFWGKWSQKNGLMGTFL